MPTNDERREVADKLRHNARNRAYLESMCLLRDLLFGDECDPVKNDMEECLNECKGEVFNRLADLIEPEPERTCRDDGVDAFRCTRCGAFALHDSVTDLCGPIPITYCPNCGAKVVE